VLLELPGGTLEVDREPDGELLLRGPVEELFSRA
jgi:hypothetical protein